VSPGRERCLNGRRAQPRQIGKEALEFGKNPPIVSRVGNQEQEVLRRVVAPLEIDPSSKRLDVAQSHLKLNRAALVPAFQHGIPCALFRPISPRWKRRFDPIRERLSHEFEKPEQPSGLAGVAYRNGAGVQPEARREPQDRGNPVQLVDRRRRNPSAFDLPIPLPGYATCRCHVLLALAQDQTAA
jgi:hypothetical protein